MKLRVPSRRRLQVAFIAFCSTLATTTLVWNQARETGRADALRPTPAPTAGPTLFNEKVEDYATRLQQLSAQRAKVRTIEQKHALGNELANLATRAHFQNQGGGELSLRAWDVALELFEEAKDRERQADTLVSRATTLALLGKPSQAESDLRRALQLASSDRLRAEALFRLGELLVVRGRYEEAGKLLDRSLGIRERSAKLAHGSADCLVALGQLNFEQGQHTLARKYWVEAAQRFAALGALPSRAAVLGQLGDVALADGDLAEAERLYSEGLSVWTELKQDFWRGRFLIRQARLCLKRRELPQAEVFAQEGLELLTSSNGPVRAADAFQVLGEIAMERRDRSTARRYLNQSLTLYRKAGRAFGQAQVERLLAQ